MVALWRPADDPVVWSISRGEEENGEKDGKDKRRKK